MLRKSKAISILIIAFLALSFFLAATTCFADEAFRINCGAKTFDFTDQEGNWWMKDESFYQLWRWGFIIADPDNDYQYGSTTHVIEGTNDDTIYQSNRWGDFDYKIELPNGTYEVRLMFAETHFTAPGLRVFDVALEGATEWTNVDIFAWAGGAQYTAMDLTKTVTISDGALDISFPTIHADLPLLSGIEVRVLDVSDDAFLDFIQKKMFWFFKNKAHPTTGLVAWGDDSWNDGSPNISSIASNGMALSVYAIAASRGWMTNQEAIDMIDKMFRSHESLLERKAGFWYHQIHMDTGARDGSFEISTVDTALFIMGALQVGEYFKDSDPTILQRAEKMYSEIDWTWFQNVGGDAWKHQYINMGWKPEETKDYNTPGGDKGGFFCNSFWEEYSETLFIDLLALGSDTYGIQPETWNNMMHRWVEHYGYTSVFYSPLFVHQYHHLYYDLREVTAQGIDYFWNSQVATYANRETVLADPVMFPDPQVWGLTASGGPGPPPGDYKNYGTGPNEDNDGTIAPSAAISSITFTEKESIECARRMYFEYKQLIWGLHGFTDSFNLSPEHTGYRNWSANALNNGEMIIAIENYRSGMPMNTFMQNRYVQQGLERAGFVAPTGVEVYASSQEGSDAYGHFAFDGDPNTRWASLHSDSPQFLEFDFNEQRTFSKLTIDWEDAYAKSYCVMVSDDRIKWTTVTEIANSDGGIDEVFFAPVTARYMRLFMQERATGWGYSIWELAVENDTSEYVLKMDEVNWTAPSAPYYSRGAAASQMVVNYMREGVQADPVDQTAIYDYAESVVPSEVSEMTPDQIDAALGHFDPYDFLVSTSYDIYDSTYDGNPYQGYNFSVKSHAPGDMNNYMRDICHWMAYQVTEEEWWKSGTRVVRPNTPAIVPLFGSYANWVVATGCVASAHPCPEPQNDPTYTPDFTVHGLWLSDPTVTGIGRDTYKVAQECADLYFQPLTTGDSYDGLLVQVAEPPAEESTAQVTLADTVASPKTLSALESLATQTLARSQTDVVWSDIVDEYLANDPEARECFQDTIMGKGIPVTRADVGSQYLLIPFYKTAYVRYRKASGVVIVDAEDGHFKEASWTQTPERFLPVSRGYAICLAFRQLLRTYNYRTIRYMMYRYMRTRGRLMDAHLEWRPDAMAASPYQPYWKVKLFGTEWTVLQDRTVIQK